MTAGCDSKMVSLKSPSLRHVSLKSGMTNADNTSFYKILLFVPLYTVFWTLIFTFALDDGFVHQEGNNVFLDALYFCVVTFTTVGYGDSVLENNTVRFFVMVAALVGLIIFGLLFGMFGKKLVDKEKNLLKSKKDRKGAKMLNSFKGKKNDDSGSETDSHGDDESSVSTIPETLLKKVSMILLWRTPVLVLIGVVGIIIGHFEDWDIMESLYYAYITATTIGYGDYSPKTEGMRVVALFFIPLSVGIVGELVGAIGGAFIEVETDAAEDEFLDRDITLEDLDHIDNDNDEVVTKIEFLTFMLTAMKKVDAEEIEEIMEKFNELDNDDSGTLDKKDLQKKKSRRLKINKETV